jgi:hypothetical protein
MTDSNTFEECGDFVFRLSWLPARALPDDQHRRAPGAPRRQSRRGDGQGVAGKPASAYAALAEIFDAHSPQTGSAGQRKVSVADRGGAPSDRDLASEGQSETRIVAGKLRWIRSYFAPAFRGRRH